MSGLGAGSPLQSLTVLTDKKSQEEERIKAYNAYAEHMKQGSLASLAGELQNNLPDLSTVLKNDIQSASTGLAQAALQALGVSMHLEDTCSSFSKDRCHELLRALCDTVTKCEDKNTITRAIWCLATQQMPTEIIQNELPAIIESLRVASTSKNNSTTVEHESINAIARLLEQVPDAMSSLVTKWAALVYRQLVHSAPKIRERAQVAMETALPMMLNHQEELTTDLVSDLKALLLSQMVLLMSHQQEMYVMKVWCWYVTLLGKTLHHGGLINQLLPLVEKAFKNVKLEVKCAAYHAWKSLIDNFALNPDIVTDIKRVKLLMQVFRINNARAENVAIEKLNVWLHFSYQLGSKLSTYFDQVAKPLLQYCAGGGSIVTNISATPGARTPLSRPSFGSPSPQMSIGSGSGKPSPEFSIVRHKGCEILLRMLGTDLVDDSSLPKPQFSIEPFPHDMVTGTAFFVKHSHTLISTFQDLVIALGAEMQEGVLLHAWYSLVAHLKNVLESSSKKEGMDVFGVLVGSLQNIVSTQALEPDKILKLLTAVLSLPPKVLGSSAYNFGTSQTNIMHNCPALMLSEMLFHHRILEVCTTQERFFSLFEKLIQCGSANQSAVLGFSEAVLTLVDKAAESVEKPESIWRMWSVVVHPLLDNITKTNEVNQGDALEHNFSSMLAVLQLPFVHILTQDLPQPTIKTLLKTWTELYGTFARLAAMVANAGANICCEELSSRLLAVSLPDKLKSSVYTSTMAQCCQCICDNIDFSSFSNQHNMLSFTGSSPQSFSPSKFHKRRQKPLGNLQSFTKLVAVTSSALYDFATSDGKNSPSNNVHPSAVVNIIQIISSVFNHLPGTAVIQATFDLLAAPLTQLFESASKRGDVKSLAQSTLQKLDKLWLDISTCIQSRYNGAYDSEFLSQLAPLLAVNFLHSRRQIKNQTIILWSATFANSARLQYPEVLRSVLFKVKQKTPLRLPGWEAVPVTVIEETPSFSQTQPSQMSQLPMPNIIGLPSPVKHAGSFMTKTASPNIKNSPLKKVSSPHVSAAKKTLALHELKNDDFIVITPSPHKPKRVLTPHQREVLRERRSLPAMYNTLENSIDISIMSEFGAESQMSQSQCSTPIDTPTFDIAAPVFPFILPNNKAKSSDDTTKPVPRTPEAEEAKTSVPKEETDKKDASEMKARTPRTRRSVRFSVDDSISLDAAKKVDFEPVKLNEKTKGQNEDSKSNEIPNKDEKLERTSESKNKVNANEVSEGLGTQGVAMETDEATEMDSEVSQSVIQTRRKTNENTVLDSESVMIIDSEDASKVSSQIEEKSETEKTDISDDISSSQTSRRSRRSRVGVVDTSQSQANSVVASDAESVSTATNESQDSSVGSQSQRRSRRVNLFETSDSAKDKGNRAESSQDSQPRRKPRSRSPKKAVGSNIDKWVVKSPRKPQPSNPSLAEETQQYSPNKENHLKAKKDKEDICVEETPVKVEKGCVIVDMSQKEDSSRILFSENILSESQVFTAQSQDSTPMKAEFVVPVLVASPVVKLQRLSPQDISVTEGSSTRKGSLRRRSSMLRFSKASMENLDNSKENAINMEDMVPSSQDSFGFKTKMVTDVNCESDLGDSQPGSDLHSSIDFSGKIAPVATNKVEKTGTNGQQESELPMDVDPVESSLESSVENKKEEDTHAADISSFEDLGSTLIHRPKKRRVRKQSGEAKKIVSDSSQDVEEHLRRTKRTPKKKKCQCGGTDHEHEHSDTSFTELMMSSQESSLSSPPSAKPNRPVSTFIDDDTLESSVESGKKHSSQLSEKLHTEGQFSDVITQDSLKTSGHTDQDVKTQRRRPGRPKKQKPEESPLQDETSSQETFKGRATRHSQEAQQNSADPEKASQEDSEAVINKKKTDKPELEIQKSQKITVAESVCIMKSPVKTRNKAKGKSDPSGKSETDGDMVEKEEKSLDDIVNKKCNLDHDSESEDDVPLMQLKPAESAAKESSNQHSDNDGPLRKLKEDKEVKPERSQKCDHDKEHVAAEVYSCVELFPGSEEQQVEETKPNETDSSFNSSMEESLSSSQKKERKYEKLSRLERNLSINMRSPKAKKMLRSSTGNLQNRTLSLAKRALQKKNKKKSSLRVSPKSKKEKTDTAPDEVMEESEEVDIIKEEEEEREPGGDSANRDSCAASGSSCALLDELTEDPMDTTAEEKKTDDHSEATAVITEPATEEQETSDTMKELSSASASKPTEDCKPVVTRTVVSPPKKGKPFDLPETPTSGTKHRSRASMILERARLVCINKSSLQNDLNKRKFTSLRPTTGSPRTILHPKRSGILKQSHDSPTKSGTTNINQDSPRASHRGSPKFRPVSMPRVYSPSASPSAGILKKRKLHEERYSDSPSPPNKQRRVSFNENIDVCKNSASPNKEGSRPVNRCLELARSQLITSPLVTSTTSKVVSAQTKFLTTPSVDDETEDTNSDGFTVPKVMTRRQETQLTPSPSLSATPESQWNSVDPICPELRECSSSVDSILPQLTSSMWITGLGQLVRARNICTVGDLSMLSEHDVSNLPIRSPKIPIMKQALQNFATQQGIKIKTPAAEAKTKSSSADVIMGSPNKSLPRVEDMLDKLSPIKGDFNTLDSSIESECETPFTLETSSSDLPGTSSSAMAIKLNLVHRDLSTRPKPERQVVNQVEGLANTLTLPLLTKVPTDHLMRIHMHLGTMMTNVALAMKGKCPVSPNSSQSSQ